MYNSWKYFRTFNAIVKRDAMYKIVVQLDNNAFDP